jgi:DNA-binding NtrC family response regulator
MNRLSCLIVDDERAARMALRRILRKLPEVSCHEADGVAEARQILGRQRIDVALIDLCLTGDVRSRDGLDLVRELRDSEGTTVPIVVSGANDMADIRAAMRMGAYDYILKDDLYDEMVLPLIEGLRSRRQLQAEVLSLRARSCDQAAHALVGTSAAIQRLRETIHRVALSDRPVLVTGPTGSGKELVVRTIHALGPHPSEPLLDLNCGALPDSLIEAELFGHERGAFTGADRQRDGFFAAVGQGTLFLDEIGELPLPLQAKLLRVLESGSFRPLGARDSRQFCGRVVAATHVDLARRVIEQGFREDLLYRLNVLEVRVPGLEERREDIPALVHHFASRQDRPLSFTPAALESLRLAAWPGNVRQLRNLVDRLAVFAREPQITPEILEEVTSGHGSPTSVDTVTRLVRELLCTAEGDKLALVERVLIEEALRQTQGNKSAAARLLGVHRKVVERRLSPREPSEFEDAKRDDEVGAQQIHGLLGRIAAR